MRDIAVNLFAREKGDNFVGSRCIVSSSIGPALVPQLGGATGRVIIRQTGNTS